MQNDHYIEPEEFDEWCYNFEKYMTELKFIYEYTTAKAIQAQEDMYTYYETQEDGQ